MNENYEKQGYLIEDFRLFHLRSAAGVRTEYHYHEFCKLLLLVSGSGSYWVGGQRYALQPGDIVLVGRGCVHKPEFEPGVPYERIIFYISPEFLSRESSSKCDLEDCFLSRWGHILRTDPNQNRQFLNRALQIEQELSAGQYGSEISSSGMLMRLLVEISRELRREDGHMPAPAQEQSDRIRKILRYIDTHLEEELSVDALAEQFYWSKYHMMRRFRAETGSSIGDYITRQRLLLARDLMGQGLSATESCFRSGFGSYSSFTRTYGKYFGTTPTGRKYAVSLQDEGDE